MRTIGRSAVAAALGLAVMGSSPALAGGRGGEVKGAAEFDKGGVLIVDGQRVRVAPQAKVKGIARGQSVPLGSEVKASGTWRPDGSLEARSLEAKPNGRDSSEQELIDTCDRIEGIYKEAGQALRSTRGGVVSLGPISDHGPDHARARAILDRILPPYVDPETVRLYVVENKDWNAFAMANFALYVHSGLLADLDDDEVAIVLGHELAHATLEHTRRTMHKGRWARIARSAASIGGDVMGGWGGVAVSLGGGLGASALGNGFSRGFEDEADRVGLRYAYEGGYDASKAPALWLRFAEKYGDGGGVGGFLFGSHAGARARSRSMQDEVARNYGAGVDDPPTRRAAAAPKPRKSSSQR